MRVGAAVGGSLGRAELVHHVDMGTEPAARALGRQPYEVRFEFELARQRGLRFFDVFIRSSELLPRHTVTESGKESGVLSRFMGAGIADELAQRVLEYGVGGDRPRTSSVVHMEENVDAARLCPDKHDPEDLASFSPRG